MTEGRFLLGSLAALAAVVALIVASPDADADPGPVFQCQLDQPCDVLTFLLGPPPVPFSTARSWEDLLFPPSAR